MGWKSEKHRDFIWNPRVGSNDFKIKTRFQSPRIHGHNKSFLKLKNWALAAFSKSSKSMNRVGSRPCKHKTGSKDNFFFFKAQEWFLRAKNWFFRVKLGCKALGFICFWNECYTLSEVQRPGVFFSKPKLRFKGHNKNFLKVKMGCWWLQISRILFLMLKICSKDYVFYFESFRVFKTTPFF